MGQKELHTQDEWRELIMECRRSGLTDKDWCEQQGINRSTFYNAISRLRKKACEIPERQAAHPMMDLTVKKQDVVAIDIVQDNPGEIKPIKPDIRDVNPVRPTANLDNSYTIELAIRGGILRISNQTDLGLLEGLLQIMRRLEC